MGLFSNTGPGKKSLEAVTRFERQLNDREYCGLIPDEEILQIWPNPFGVEIYILSTHRLVRVSEKIKDLRALNIGFRSIPAKQEGKIGFQNTECDYVTLNHLEFGNTHAKATHVINVNMTAIAEYSVNRLLQNPDSVRFFKPPIARSRVVVNSKEYETLKRELQNHKYDENLDWISPLLIKCPKCGKSDPVFRSETQTSISGNWYAIESSTYSSAVFICKECQIDMAPLTRIW